MTQVERSADVGSHPDHRIPRSPDSVARLARLNSTLDPADRRNLLGMAATILLLHAVGFGLLALSPLISRHPAANHPTLSLGLGMLAYTLGMRHAFDVDHVAAIDNVTRKLVGDRAEGTRQPSGLTSRPLTVGFWFSLGHSSVVLFLTLAVTLGAKVVDGPLPNDAGSVIGPTVSGAFLWMVGLLNVGALLTMGRARRRHRNGLDNAADLEAALASRGLLNRLLGRITTSVAQPRRMYSVGLLFGLGFDTATEVGLLVLAGGAAAGGSPICAVIILPALFAAGMCLMDSADCILMNAAYDWAFGEPARKVAYNLTITAMSVALALVVGTIELAGVLADRLAVSTGPLRAIASVNLTLAGSAIVAVSAAIWGLAHALAWKRRDKPN